MTQETPISKLFSSTATNKMSQMLPPPGPMHQVNAHQVGHRKELDLLAAEIADLAVVYITVAGW